MTTIPDGRAFRIAVKFKKVLTDPLAPDGLKTAAEGRCAEGLATTWEREILGQAQDADSILSGVSRLPEEFLDEYLRVNERTGPR